MIRPQDIRVGDYVVADTNIHDFAVPGTVFKIIDRTIIGLATSALGWMVDPTTGDRKSGGTSYPLPHDKISLMPRRDFAALILKQKSPLMKRRKELDQQIAMIDDRANTILRSDDRNDECRSFLYNTLRFC